MRTLWTLAVASGLNMVTFAPAAAADHREFPTIEVVVVNDANVPAETLNLALALAGRIYTRMNIHIVWKDSKAAPSTAPTAATLRLAVLIVPVSKFGHGVDTMGFAFNRGTVAYIFYRRVGDFSQQRSISIASALGHTLGHEIGHLLLPDRPHGAAGIMRSKWDRDNELTILKNLGMELGFTSEETLVARGNAVAKAK